MRIADAEGKKNYRVAISIENGKPTTYTLIVDNTKPATDTDTDPNIWDEVLNDAAHKKRSA
jgi:hypothetical protein